MTELAGARLCIADDHAAVRGALRIALEQAGAEVVGEASNGEEAADQILSLRPDVAILDVSMPLMSGLSALRAVKSAWPQARIVMLTMLEDADHRAAALEAGASAYLLKTASFDSVLTEVAKFVPSAASSRPVRVVDAESENELSARQIDVLQCLVNGLSPVQTARQLGISKNTVNNHLAAIYRRLGTANATQAVVAAARLGLVDIFTTTGLTPTGCGTAASSS